MATCPVRVVARGPIRTSVCLPGRPKLIARCVSLYYAWGQPVTLYFSQPLSLPWKPRFTGLPKPLPQPNTWELQHPDPTPCMRCMAETSQFSHCAIISLFFCSFFPHNIERINKNGRAFLATPAILISAVLPLSAASSLPQGVCEYRKPNGH